MDFFGDDFFGGVITPEYSETLQALEVRENTKSKAQIKREQWEKSRLGIFSGSEIERLCSYETKTELPEGALTYVSEKVYECLFEEKYKGEIFETEDILRGRKYEPIAIQYLEKETNITFSFTGENQKFFKRSGFGSTPDGLSKRYSLEVKCPNFVNHNKFKRMRKGEDLKSANKGYWLQVQSEMYCTKRDKAIFCSFYVNEKTGFTDLFWIIINKCEKTQNLITERVRLANIEKRKELKSYKK